MVECVYMEEETKEKVKVRDEPREASEAEVEFCLEDRRQRTLKRRTIWFCEAGEVGTG